MKNACWKILFHRYSIFSLNEVVNMTTVFFTLFPFFLCAPYNMLLMVNAKKNAFVLYTAISHNVLDLTVEFSCSFQVSRTCTHTMIPHWFHFFLWKLFLLTKLLVIRVLYNFWILFCVPWGFSFGLVSHAIQVFQIEINEPFTKISFFTLSLSKVLHYQQRK